MRNNHNMIFSEYPDVVTVEELMKMLRIGRNTAYAIINSGEIRSVKVKNQIRIPKHCVISYLNGEK